MIVPNAIEREIVINAPIARVWELVSRPGWFINTGTIREHRIEERGDKVVVIDDELGEFVMSIDEVRPPSYLACRGYADDVTTGLNRVEFFLDETEQGVRVRVVETGFAALPDDVREQAYRDNVGGWETELAAAKQHLEAEDHPEGGGRKHS